MFNKYLLSSILTSFFVFCLFATGNSAAAIDSKIFNDSLGKTAGQIGYKTEGISNVRVSIASYIGFGVGVIISLVGVIFMVLIFLGALDIMRAGGNDELVNKGKNRIKNGAIGILIIFSAYIITVLILNIASGGFSGINLFKTGL